MNCQTLFSEKKISSNCCLLNLNLKPFFNLGPVVQSVVSLTSSLRVISLTVLADSIYSILIFFAEKMCKSYSHFFSKKFQHICISINVNFNESLNNDVVSFEQLGPDINLEQGLYKPINANHC